MNAGDKVDLKTADAVLAVASGSTIDLIEKRDITHEGQIAGNLEVAVTSAGGTYTSTILLFLPPDAKPGIYAVRTTVQAANTSDTLKCRFHVRE